MRAIQRERKKERERERACRCVSELSTCRALRATRPVRGSAPHAYTCRTTRDLCHWLRSVHRRAVYRSFHVYGSRRSPSEERLRLSPIYPSDDEDDDVDREPDRRSFTPADRRLLDFAARARVPFPSLSAGNNRAVISRIVLVSYASRRGCCERGWCKRWSPLNTSSERAPYGERNSRRTTTRSTRRSQEGIFRFIAPTRCANRVYNCSFA